MTACRRVVPILIAWVLLVLAAPAGAQTAPNPSFNLLNRSQTAINEIYATPKGRTTWGRDRLGDRSLPPGGSFPVRLPADGSCAYDIRVVYEGGRAEERRDIDTCAIDSVTFPRGTAGGVVRPQSQSADDPSFRLVNRGRQAVNAVYATPTGVRDWGQDRLGDATVAPGASRSVRLPAGQCSYDVRVVYANGDATERRDLNLCTLTDLAVP